MFSLPIIISALLTIPFLFPKEFVSLAVCRREVVGLPKCGLAGYSETVRPVPHFWNAQPASALRQLGV